MLGLRRRPLPCATRGADARARAAVPAEPCDGLECLCRPRFFAGSAPDRRDLRRLDHYIVAKNRLHNRYLHGTGVVCGLEVVCNPCDDTVTVRTGYAIGPCGEDIVVCADTAVDVGELIRDAAASRRGGSTAMPYGGRPAQDCEAARQRWILAICYDERPSRGVTSLRRPALVRLLLRFLRRRRQREREWSRKPPGDACSCGQHPSAARQCEPTRHVRGLPLRAPQGTASSSAVPAGSIDRGGLADSELGPAGAAPAWSSSPPRSAARQAGGDDRRHSSSSAAS